LLKYERVNEKGLLVVVSCMYGDNLILNTYIFPAVKLLYELK
jgi:hypothetical protein